MATRRRRASQLASLDSGGSDADASTTASGNLVVRGAGNQLAPNTLALVEGARQAAEAAERRAGRPKCGVSRPTGRRRTGRTNDVLSRLPSDSAASLSALRPARVLDSHRSTLARPGGDPRSDLYGFDSCAGRIAVISIGSASQIDRLVADWRQAIASEGLPGNVSTSRAAGQALRRRIWEPFLTGIEGASRVFIVPDGAINLVPFAALPTATRSYLIETGPTIHYLTAERDLYDLVDSSPAVGRGLLAVGGPAFGSSPAPPAAGGASRPPAQSGAGSGCADFRNAHFAPPHGLARRGAADHERVEAFPSRLGAAASVDGPRRQ